MAACYQPQRVRRWQQRVWGHRPRPQQQAPTQQIRAFLCRSKPRTHLKQTRRNAPGAAPPIVTAEAPTRRSPRLHDRVGAPRPKGEPSSGRIPLHQPDIITQAVIDLLTEDVYYGANLAFWTPNKCLQFDPVNTGTDVDTEHFCAPIVHPETGETITSYRKLAKDAVTKKTWTKEFGKEFGNLAQGDDKTGRQAWMLLSEL